MQVRVKEREASANSRLTAIRLASVTLRCMENWSARVGDYDSAMILVAIVAITAEKLARTDLEPPLRDLSQPLPPDTLTRCNISSIAAATGINREKVRRKVKVLVEQGLVERRPDRSVRFREGVLQEPETLELVRAYYRIGDPTVRARLFDLVKALGGTKA